jgi:hypothetical protein
MIDGFDCSVCRNPSWGLRDIDDVKKLAEQHGLILEKIVSEIYMLWGGRSGGLCTIIIFFRSKKI